MTAARTRCTPLTTTLAEYLVTGERPPWILLATVGDGVESERWKPVADHPTWMDYELCRHNDAGDVRWTWRRTKAEMTQLCAELREDLTRKRYGSVEQILRRVANQPGFHGVRAQSHALVQYAQARGYSGQVPRLYYISSVSYGTPIFLGERIHIHQGGQKPSN